MAATRLWRPSHVIEGPSRIRHDDIAAINQVFSDAFTERYRRDGLVGVRVPQLHPAVWRYAIADAGDGAMVWRDEHGAVAAFNIAHCSGVEGWMGPLAVRPDCQGNGLGKEIVRAGMRWLRTQRVRTIGLETMPRTMDNIGFYSLLGFQPDRLTLTVTLEAAPAPGSLVGIGALEGAERDVAVAACRSLVDRMLPGYDFSREMRLTTELELGETLLLRDHEGLHGFAVCHTAPLVDGRSHDEVRVLKLVLRDDRYAQAMAAALRDLAHRNRFRRVAIRVQGEYLTLYRRLVEMGARLRWTDLRMTAVGYGEPVPAAGVVLSNWEI